MCWPVLATLFMLVQNGQAANVLAIFPMPTPSHNILAKAIVRELLNRGHKVTMITAFPMEDKPENYTEIFIDELLEYRKGSMNHSHYNASQIELITNLLQDDSLSKITFENLAVQELMKSNETFDVIILEVIMCEALLGFGHFYKAPSIVVNAIGSTYVTSRMVANSEPYAYVPLPIAAFTDEMSFLERLLNTAIITLFAPLYTLISLPVQDKVLHHYIPEAPPLDDLIHNVSVILLNSHFSIVETPRPYMPNMIPVGGLHVQPQELPQDLKTLLDSAEGGAVLFSLGTNVKSANLPHDKIQTILKTFSRFDKQLFLWKFENDTLDVPENVKIRKWVPQRAVLEHPNTKAFISHGGLLSITEAVYYGIPFIGVPAFADQHYNVANAVHRKFAIKYNMNNLDEETFASAIREILKNSTYRENIAVRSSLLREQPVPPLDLAMYWIEHVVKYGGASYLKSAGVRLGWMQSYLLDVIAFLIVLAVVFVYVSYFVIKQLIRFCRRKLITKKLKAA